MAEPEPSPDTRGFRAAPWRRRILRSVVLLALLGAVVVGASNLWVRLSAARYEHSVADAPSAPVALVLGAGLKPDGTPSPALQARLDDAARLYQLGKVKALLVSGDNGTVTHDEPTAMRDYLVAQGVPAGKVIRDYAGFDTWDSCVRAKKIFGVDRALVVTQQYHLPRAVFLCRRAGIDADGVADPHADAARLSFTLREIPAAVKAAWDAVATPVAEVPRRHGARHPTSRWRVSDGQETMLTVAAATASNGRGFLRRDDHRHGDLLSTLREPWSDPER
jgi:vancomycin permeability regulator SanA